MAQHIKLGYWGLRGRAQIARLLLAYTGAQWENVAYSDPNVWFANDKPNLGFDFPNLPYLIDGDLKITQSTAIERYIIAKSGNTQLLGKNIQDSAKVNELLGVFIDIRTSISGLFFDKDYENKLKQTWEKVKAKYDFFEKFVGNKQWALGYLTLADFYVAELSNYFEKLYPEQFKAYPSLNRIRQNFNNLVQIKQYYAKQDSVKGPFLPPHYAVIKF